MRQTPAPQATWPRVVIVGAGFGGLEAAKALRHVPVQVTVIDRWNHHLFQPMLYQVATAGLSIEDISAPIRRIFHRQANASVLMAEVIGVDTGEHTVLTAGQVIPYDYLILATGVSSNYFGHFQQGKPLPGLSPVAMQEGRYVARVIARQVAGHTQWQPFRYRDKGTLATVGRAFAVVDIGPLRFTGLLAWLTWIAVHIMYLIGFRNRLLVLIQYAWAYLTFQPGARIILPGGQILEQTAGPSSAREERNVHS